MEVCLSDCIKFMKALGDNTVDAVVCDPPYELGFMGKKWDNTGIAFQVETWEEVLRVLKPGGHLLAFGGTRLYHRMTCAIEDSGFEIRDCLMWVYGCLSEDTEILTDAGWVHYNRATQGRCALCYDKKAHTFSWRPIQDTVVYDYDDTAFKIQSDHTDQLVSKNHRCLVERRGDLEFQVAEDAAREQQIHVPILEDLSSLLQALPLPEQSTNSPQPDLQHDVQKQTLVKPKGRKANSTKSTQREDNSVHQLPKTCVETSRVAQERQAPNMLSKVQRDPSCKRIGETLSQRPQNVDSGIAGVVPQEDVGSSEPCLERRGNVYEETRELSASEICEMPKDIQNDGTSRRVRDGTPLTGRPSSGAKPSSHRSGASRQPQCGGQQCKQSGPVPDQSSPQAIRASRYSSTTLARITPVHYKGVMWCVSVPTGAFVARRNGKIFVTGNSGFPKSLNVSKAIDKAAGAERKVIGKVQGRGSNSGEGRYNWNSAEDKTDRRFYDKTSDATDAAKQWNGWGTALKPAWEPIVLARKPLSEKTVAANVLKWGTGALNISGCRIGTGTGSTPNEAYIPNIKNKVFGKGMGGGRWDHSSGRWPANFTLSHDPRCVLVGHNEGNPSKAQDKMVTTKHDAPAKFGYSPDRHQFNYEGESQDVWACVPGCPVRLLDGQSGNRPGSHNQKPTHSKRITTMGGGAYDGAGFSDSGGASRFFYCAKTSTKERNAGLPKGQKNKHPTVKPLKLIRYLVRLVSPPRAIVLDPFAGSGTTVCACALEGFECLSCDNDPESVKTANLRIAHWESVEEEPQKPTKRKPAKKIPSPDGQSSLF